jgi:hypothetical protein
MLTRGVALKPKVSGRSDTRAQVEINEHVLNRLGNDSFAPVDTQLCCSHKIIACLKGLRCPPRTELDGRGVGVRVPVEARFSPLHSVQTGSGAHPASYLMGTGGSFPRN